MRIIKYLEFIRESTQSKKEIRDIGQIWKLEHIDISELLYDMKDEGWKTSINFGFLDDDDEFTEKVLPNVETPVAYETSFWSEDNETKGADVTDSFLFIYDMIESKLEGKMQIADGDGPNGIDKENLLFKGGIFVKDESFEIRDYISIIASEKELYEFTEEEVAEYYGWSYSMSDNYGNIYLKISKEDLANEVLQSDQYREMIINRDIMWDSYESHYYIPTDIQSMLYSLDKENLEYLIRAMIKESGGWESIKGEDIVIDNDIIGYNDEVDEDKFIELVSKERFHRTLELMCNESEISTDIKQTIAEWEMSAHVDDNYDTLISEFEDEIGKIFEFTKFEETIEKEITYTRSDGKKHTSKYDVVETYYKIGFDNSWIKEWDYDDLCDFDDIDGVFRNYHLEEMDLISLSPYFRDYGNVDSKALNVEIKSMLKRYLN